MGDLYAASFRSAAPAAATFGGASPVLCQLRSTSSKRIWLREATVLVSATSATLTGIVLVRSTALGTASTTIAGNAQDPAAPATIGTLDTVLSGNPTIAALGMRAAPTNAIGEGFYWAFGPLEMLASNASGLCLAALATVAAITLDVSVVWEE